MNNEQPTKEQGVEPAQPRCEGCGHEIDPDYCWRGSDIKHSPWEGHEPIPMGCECGRSKDGECD